MTMTNSDVTRRELLELAVVTGGALAGGQFMAGAVSPAAAQGAGAAPAPLDIVLRVNGTEHRLRLDPRTTLLDALREHLHLAGSKKGCGLGQCGACTVLMDGKRVKSCLSLAALVEGREITTIEGLAQGDQLHPLQAAFTCRCAARHGRDLCRRAYEEYSESLLDPTRFLHSCPSVYTRHRLAPMNVHTPTMFTPGARSAWHTHPAGQLLIVTSGTGWVQEEGGVKREIKPSDVIWTSPGVKHWHGATTTNSMSHIAITNMVNGKNVEWLEKVSDEQYQK
jgi:xanthine dehydrogenase YagT iron-sulfur-binding subunit